MKSTTPRSSPSRISCRLTQAAWNPYLVGAGIAILSWLIFLLARINWIEKNSLSVEVLGKTQLDEIIPIPAPAWIGLLVLLATWLSHRLPKTQPLS